jgi:hypothetical protein
LYQNVHLHCRKTHKKTVKVLVFVQARALTLTARSLKILAQLMMNNGRHGVKFAMRKNTHLRRVGFYLKPADEAVVCFTGQYSDRIILAEKSFQPSDF